MTSHLTILVVVIPLASSLVIPLVGLFSRRAVQPLALLAHVVTLGLTLATLGRVLAEGSWSYHLGGWMPPWGIEYVVDPLSAGMAVLISGMALLTMVYAAGCLDKRNSRHPGLSEALFLLLTAGLLGIVMTGDMFNLYVFLEISSIAAYALLTSEEGPSLVATFRYLLVGTIAASLYLLGTGYLYALTGTLNMADLGVRLSETGDSMAVVVGVSLVVIGLAVKAAVFPLHGWLPDTYTYAPVAVVGFIGAVMTKVSAYALFRILFFVLDAQAVSGAAVTWLGWLAVVAVVAGSWMALAQTDVRRMLAYSSVGQMGFIVIGFSLGNVPAMVGGLFHLLNHAVMKGCLFLVAGGVRWRTGATTVKAYAGMGRRFPLSMAAFLVAALSMIGLPPTAGFFSKWYLLVGAFEAQAWVVIAAVIVSSALSAIYFFRVLEKAFFHASDEINPASEGTELPGVMVGPVVILAVVVLLLGILNEPIVTHFVMHALPPNV